MLINICLALRLLYRKKVYFTSLIYLLCPLNPLSKIVAHFTPPNYFIWSNLPLNYICIFLFLHVQVEFQCQILPVSL
jgi:hypothetical protein